MNQIDRPEATILPAAALVPPGNLIAPPPNQFTHAVTQPQPYFFHELGDAPAATAPDGWFSAGTRVVLLVHAHGPYCHVVDGQGLYVVTAYTGLKRLRRRAT
jgi:hypothetical protein